MAHLYSFQPLHFAALDAFIQQKRNVERDDLNDFMSQFGFDNRGYKDQLHLGKKFPSNWISKYFSPDDAQFLSLPYRMPGIGAPYDMFRSDTGKQFTGNMEQFMKEFLLGQPVTIEDALRPGNYVPSANDAMHLRTLIDDALMYAGGAHAILENKDEGTKQVTKNVINGQVKGPTSRVFTIANDPAEYKEQTSKYKEDIAKIMPFVGDGQALGLLNFANGLSVDGQPSTVAYEKLRKSEWNVPAQMEIVQGTTRNSGYLYTGELGKRIRRASEIPGKSQVVYEQDFLADRFNQRKRYKFDQKRELWTRFAEPHAPLL